MAKIIFVLHLIIIVCCPAQLSNAEELNLPEPVLEVGSCKRQQDADPWITLYRGVHSSLHSNFYLKTYNGIDDIFREHKEYYESINFQFIGDEKYYWYASSFFNGMCLGQNNELFIMTVSPKFIGNNSYIIAARYVDNKTIQRLDSFERSFPSFLYFNNNGMKIVHVDTTYAHKKYYVYSTRDGKHLGKLEHIDELPNKDGFTVVHLPSTIKGFPHKDAEIIKISNEIWPPEDGHK